MRRSNTCRPAPGLRRPMRGRQPEGCIFFAGGNSATVLDGAVIEESGMRGAGGLLTPGKVSLVPRAESSDSFDR
jgi:hypothetical protein